MEEKSGESGIPDDSALPGRGIDEKSGSTPIPQSTTRPDELRRHDISDEELEMLSSSRRDGLLEAIWGFAGIGAGSSIPAIDALLNHFKSEDAIPLSITDLLQVLFLSCSVILVVTLLVIRSKREKGTDDLVKEIRARKAS